MARVFWSFFYIGNLYLMEALGSRERTEMKVMIPWALYDLYSEEKLYNALRARIPELPAYAEGSYYMTNEAVAAVQAMDLPEQAEVAYEAIEEVHEEVRKSLPAQQLFLEEDFQYELKNFLELWLAGYKLFGSLAHKLVPWLETAGFSLRSTFSASEYEAQMLKIEEMDLEHLPLLTNIYLEKRREKAAELNIADEGDLRDYISEKNNDVFGVIYGTSGLCPAHRNTRRQIADRMYHNYDSTVFAHNVLRQIIRANGGGTPIRSW